MPSSDVECRVDISEDKIIESERPAAGGEVNTGAAVAEQKPPYVSHTRPGKIRKHMVQLRALIGLCDAANRPPCIGTEIDPVVDPRKVGADQKGRRRIGLTWHAHIDAGSLRSRDWPRAGRLLRNLYCLVVCPPASDARRGHRRPHCDGRCVSR